jgi:hypothetical protein
LVAPYAVVATRGGDKRKRSNASSLEEIYWLDDADWDDSIQGDDPSDR